MQIDIVIVNWNSSCQLAACVESVIEHSEFRDFSIVVVDNGSIDGSTDFLREQDVAKVLRTNTNLGFAKACNLGALVGCAEFLLFLNPDAALRTNTLTKALAVMTDSANKDIGICGVQLFDESGEIARSCTRFPNAWGFIANSLGLVRIFPKLGHFMAEWSHDQTREVDHVIGAFFLMRRSVFEGLDGFDERFFLYLEDLDFSYRAQKGGWKTMYLADVQAFHAGGGTSNQVKAKRLFYSLRSRLLYAFKHFTLPGALLVLMATLLLEPITRSALAIGRRSWSSLAETWTGYGMLFRWLPQWCFKGVTR